MKRWTCLLLVSLLIMLYSSALAGNFSIHSDVTFGMTVDEVIACEKANGFSPEFVSMLNNVKVNGKIAGLNNSTITYSFGDGKMVKANYILAKHAAYNPETMQQDYATISQALQSKYGSTDFNSETLHAYTLPSSHYLSSSISVVSNYNDWNKGTAFSASCECYEQWLIMQNDGSGILIDHALRKYTGTKSTEYQHAVIYTHLDSSIVSSISHNIEEQANDL